VVNAPAALPLGKRHNKPLYRRLEEPWGWPE